MSKHESLQEPAEKRGRGRPAFRPLDLPPSKPLRKASSSSAESQLAPPRVRPKQATMEQFLPQQPAATRPLSAAGSLGKQQHSVGTTPEQLPLHSQAMSPTRDFRSRLSPIPEELSELQCTEPGPGELEAMRQTALQHTPLRPPLVASAGLSDLHSGLTPDLCSLVLRDLNHDPAPGSEGVLTPQHYGIVAKRLEDLFDSSKQASDAEADASHRQVALHDDLTDTEEQLLDANLDPLQLARNQRARSLGRYGLAAEALTVRPSSELRPQNYSVSLIAGVTQDSIVGAQLVEGGVDASVFEHFIQELLKGLRDRGAFDGPGVVLLLDNARIHHHSLVLEAARAQGVHVLFNAEYSPWLNPVEALFGLVKRKVKASQVATR